MFHKIPQGSRIIGKKYDRFIWETPDEYKLMIASGDSDKDTRSVINNRHKLGSRLDLTQDLSPDKESRIVELNNPGQYPPFELETTISPRRKSNKVNLDNLLAFNDIDDNVTIGDIGSGKNIEVKYKDYLGKQMPI